MTPCLFHFKILGLSVGLSYFGLFLGLGGAVGAVVAAAVGSRHGVRARVALGMCFWAAAVGIIVARLGGLLLGGTSHGLPLPMNYAAGLTAAALAAAAFARTRGLAPWLGVDLLGCGLAAAHAISALGCFAGGCCYGRIAAPGAAFALAFDQGTVAWHDLALRGLVPLGAPLTPPLYAVQLVEAAALAGATLVLVLLARRARGGAVLGAYLVVAAAVWLGLAPWRADPWRGVVMVTGLALAGIALTLWSHARSTLAGAPGSGVRSL